MAIDLTSFFNQNIFFRGTYPAVIEKMSRKRSRTTLPRKIRETLKARQRKTKFSDCSCGITPGDFPVLAVIKDYTSKNESPAYDNLFFRDRNNPGRFSFPFDIPKVKNIYFIGYQDHVEIVSADPLPKSYNSSIE